MFQNSGLSLDQAPPISVVLRFFLVGGLFGITAGLWLLLQGVDAVTASLPAGQIMTHLLTLGVMLSFMLGALFQMLPVLAGIALSSPVLTSIRTQYPQIVGVIFLLLGFQYGNSALFWLAGIFLALALIPPANRMLGRLLALESHSSSSRGMGFALFNLLVLLILGLALLGMRSGMNLGDYSAFKAAHLAFGLYGWVALLIVSVSFQVIEMFYVTPPYPRLVGRYLPFGISALLTLELIAALDFPAAMPFIEATIALALLGYSLLSLRRLSQRKRPIADATVWFWRVGMGSLALASLLLFVSGFTELSTPFQELLYTLYSSFALSILFAMAYKIVPFLTWFHLNAQGYFTAPMMHEVIHPRYAMRHLYLHATTLFVAAAAAFSTPALWQLVGALLSLEFAWLSLAIYRAWHQYLHIQKTGERFDMGAFGP